MKFPFSEELILELKNTTCPTHEAYYEVLIDTPVDQEHLLCIVEQSGKKSLEALIKFYRPENIAIRSKIEEMGFDINDIVAILSKIGGSENLDSLIKFYSVENDSIRTELAKDGFAKDLLLLILAQRSGSYNFTALLELYKNKQIKKELLEEGFDIYRLTHILEKTGGHTKLDMLIDFYQPEKKEQRKILNSKGISTANIEQLLCKPGDSGNRLNILIELFISKNGKLFNQLNQAHFYLDDILKILIQTSGHDTLNKLNSMLSNPDIHNFVAKDFRRKESILQVITTRGHARRILLLSTILENKNLRDSLSDITAFRTLSKKIIAVNAYDLDIFTPAKTLEELNIFIQPRKKRKNDEISPTPNKDIKINPQSSLTFFTPPKTAPKPVAKILPTPIEPTPHAQMINLLHAEEIRISSLQKQLAPQLSQYISPTSIIAALYKNFCEAINNQKVTVQFVYLTFITLESCPFMIDEMQNYLQNLDDCINKIISLVGKIMSSGNQLLIQETTTFMSILLRFNDDNLLVKGRFQDYIDHNSASQIANFSP